MAVKLLHLPLAREITTREITTLTSGTFDSEKVARKFLKEHKLFFLTAQDTYIAYENAVFDAVKIPVTEFITRESGYHIQECEIDIVPVN